MAGWASTHSGIPNELDVIANDISKYFWYNHDETSLGIKECERLAKIVIDHKKSKEKNE